jgi:heat shock protein HspQ
LHDETGARCRHPLIETLFEELPDGSYAPLEQLAH